MLNNEYLIQIVICGVCFLIDLISLFIFFKKNKNLNYKIKLAKILQMLPDFISQAEKNLGAGNGLSKLSFVLQNIHLKCLELKVSYNEQEWRTEVERVLDTPQKKGENNEASKNA